MPFACTAFRVAIASPGDVREERRIIREVIHDWNAAHARTRGVVLLPVGWESDVASLMGSRAQAVINEQVIRTADLLIATFWTRLGTPTGVASSGSVEEIEEFLRDGKPVMIYFSAAPVVPSSIDMNQYSALLEFRKWCELNGLVGAYESATELRGKLSRELALLINSHPSFNPQDVVAPDGVDIDALIATAAVARDPATTLSPEAKDLLEEATKDFGGTVLVVETIAGLSIEANRQSFVPEGDPRTASVYRDAVRELVDAEYLRPVGSKGEVFDITRQGYEAADRIRKGKAGGA